MKCQKMKLKDNKLTTPRNTYTVNKSYFQASPSFSNRRNY